MSIMPDRSPLLPSRADLAISVLAIALPTAVTWLYFIALDGADRWLQQGAYGAGKTVQFALPLVWICLVHGIRPALSRPAGWSLVVGGAFGFAVAAAMMVLYLVVLKPAGTAPATTADALMSWVAERVAPHKRIREVQFIEQIPKSATGKILRRLLMQR